jgi:hypothetical protein
MQKVFVAGGRGLTGKSLELVACRYPNFEIFYHCRDLGDLTDSRVVQKVLGDLNPELIILNAASLAGAHGSKTEQQMYSIRDYTIHENFINLATIDQKVICYSSYHVFGGLAPFLNVNALNLNYESDYAKEKSREIEASLAKSNVKFIIFPHLFGRYDSFKVNRAHFIANSIRRIKSAEENNQREIQFFGNRKRLLQKSRQNRSHSIRFTSYKCFDPYSFWSKHDRVSKSIRPLNSSLPEGLSPLVC